MASHVFAAPPTDAGLDSDLGNLEKRTTPQTGCALEAFFTFFLIWGIVMVCYKAQVGGTCQRTTHMEGRTQRFPAKHRPKHHTGSSGSACILVLMCSLGTPTQTTIHMMEKRKQTSLIQSSMVMFWYSSAHRLPVELKIHRLNQLSYSLG